MSVRLTPDGQTFCILIDIQNNSICDNDDDDDDDDYDDDDDQHHNHQ